MAYNPNYISGTIYTHVVLAYATVPTRVLIDASVTVSLMGALGVISNNFSALIPPPYISAICNSSKLISFDATVRIGSSIVARAEAGRSIVCSAKVKDVMSMQVEVVCVSIIDLYKSIPVLVSLSSGMAPVTYNSLSYKFSPILSFFGSLGSIYTVPPVFVGNSVVVVNLRTKAHYTFTDESTEATAITGELLFGSQKNKNVSDMYINGRSSDAFAVTMISGETVSRESDVSFKSSEQSSLQNKRLKLAKGLTGYGWQIKITSPQKVFTEVRSIDLTFNELRRHI